MSTKPEEKHYGSSFYKNQESGSLNSAKVILPLILNLLKPQSVIDVGCGTGVWLKVCQDLGVEEIKGIEGMYSENSLRIDKQYVAFHDLKLKYTATKRYDMAMTLEVAEHLPESAADLFVKTLTDLSDIVLFSAALYKQGGTYHINEQFPEYWGNKFLKLGYIPIDYIRPRIWTDKNVEYWYKQNILLFVKKDKVNNLPEELKKAQEQTFSDALLRIHPDHYHHVFERMSLKWKINDKYYRLKKYFRK